MTIDGFIEKLEADALIYSTIKAALDAYNESFEINKTWCEAIAYIPKNEGQANTGDADKKPEDFDKVEYLVQMNYVSEFFKNHNIEPISKKETTKDTILYVWCPWKEKHTTPHNNTESFVAISKENGKIRFYCNHNHCTGKTWKDYKRYYEDRDSVGVNTPPEMTFDIKLVSGRELQQKNLPPIVYPISNMIPEGYSVFSGPYKSGKSWLSLEMCLSVAEGIPFLDMETEKGAAVYLALEDCEKFAQERLNIALQGRDCPENFFYIYEGVPTLDDGFIQYLDQLHDIIKNLKIVIVDVLVRIEYQTKRGESAYKSDYRTGTALKQWADKHQVSVIAVTHTTKMVHPDDVFLNTSGTNGVTGSADAILTIAKEKRTDKEAVLAITGRRVREKYLKMRLDDGWNWISEGECDPDTMRVDQEAKEQQEQLEEYMNSPIRQAVIKIAEHGEGAKAFRATQIIDEARKHKILLLSTPKSVGKFLHVHQNRFAQEDNVEVQILKNGTGGATYILKWWDEELSEDNPYIENTVSVDTVDEISMKS